MVNDTTEQQILFMENMNLMKLVSAIFAFYQNASFISFRPQKRAKVIMITIIKHLEPSIVVEQF